MTFSSPNGTNKLKNQEPTSDVVVRTKKETIGLCDPSLHLERNVVVVVVVVAFGKVR